MKRALLLAVLAVFALPRTSAGVDCPNCPGVFSLPAHICALPGLPIQTGTGCGGQLKNCQTPELIGPRTQIVPTGPGTYEARLVVEARAPWNSDPATQSSGKLKLYWTQFELCQNGLVDRQETYLAYGEVKCGGAPYNFGEFTLRAVACEGGGSCQKQVILSAMPLKVERSAVCGEPPKWTCCADGTCGTCVRAGAGSASPGGEGASAAPPMAGPGATLRYRAGGTGFPGWPGTATWNQSLGRGWSHDYAERIVQDPGAGHVWMLTRDATFREFTDGNADGTYETVSPSDEYRDLFKVPAGWELRGLDGSVQSFDSTGLWTRTVDRNGNEKLATYTAGALTRVDFPDGRREDFAYWPDGKLHTITEVGVDGTSSRTWTYTWSGLDLARIDRPDGTAWEMFYSSNPGLAGYLTRIDLRGTGAGLGRVETAWEYDDQGNVTRIWKGDPVATGPAAVELSELTYDTPVLPTKTVVKDSLGRESVYYLGRDPGSRKPKITRLEDGCAVCGQSAKQRLEYNDPANPLLPTAIVDGKDHRTEYAYNADGRRTLRREAAGTALARETRWQYDPVFRAFPTRVERPSMAGGADLRVTEMAYDAEGNLLTRTESGKERSSSFAYTTVMTYNPGGQLLSIDPPGHGTGDMVTFTYNPARGNGSLVPLTRTDALGTVSFTHDAFNRRTGVTDLNNVLTLTGYDLLNRVTSATHDGGGGPSLVTIYEHDAFGDLFRTHRPEGNLLGYAYDSAGRLLSIETRPDIVSHGERTFFTLDAAGHRIREDLQRWSGSAWVTESWTEFDYSSRCYLDKVVRPGGAVTEYGYDCNGNLANVWDANHPRATNSIPTQTYAYDLLDRLESLTQPWTGAGGGDAVTRYGYDVQDHLAQVTDAEGNVTRYTYSDRDLLTREESPVSGVTDSVYNEHGELEEETDARSVTVNRSYDALDRLLTVSYPDPSLDVTYAYDSPGSFAKGRLTGITRHGETIAYDYDRFGRMTRDGALIYAYDDNGNRIGIGYPDAVNVVYTYDYADRQKSLALSVDGSAPATLADNATYKPFGPLASLALGNGLTETRSYGQRYQPEGIRLDGTSTLFNWSYTVDLVGNITAIGDVLNSANNRTYGYQDNVYFLTQGNGPWGLRSWTYDRIGNRLTESRGGVTDSYVYPTNTAAGHNPKLQSITLGAGGSRSYGYDPIGDTIQIVDADQQLDLIHDAARRLTEMISRPEDRSVALAYDGRSFLSEAGDDEAGCFPKKTFALYDSEGLLHRREHHLLDGASTVFLDSDTVLSFAGKPLAVLNLTASTSKLTYLTSDHLGTPAAASSEGGGLVWQGGFEPFGATWNTTDTAVFLRFPGQWSDEGWTAAAGELHYNLYRWYSHSNGQYEQADSLPNLRQGNLYSYAQQSPITLSDPLGLFVIDNSCDCERRLPDNIPRALAKATQWAKSSGCSAALAKYPEVKRCFADRFSPDQAGKDPTIICHSTPPPEGNFCGSNTPQMFSASAAIHLFPGGSHCPRNNPKIGIGATIVHETLHGCGLFDETKTAEVTKACTGYDARP
jgi:RHS repeat-associated protein